MKRRVMCVPCHLQPDMYAPHPSGTLWSFPPHLSSHCFGSPPPGPLWSPPQPPLAPQKHPAHRACLSGTREAHGVCVLSWWAPSSIAEAHQRMCGAGVARCAAQRGRKRPHAPPTVAGGVWGCQCVRFRCARPRCAVHLTPAAATRLVHYEQHGPCTAQARPGHAWRAPPAHRARGALWGLNSRRLFLQSRAPTCRRLCCGHAISAAVRRRAEWAMGIIQASDP